MPVTSETTSLRAIATAASGATATHALALAVAPTSTPLFVLHANPSSGVAPLTVNFSVAAGFDISQVELDADADGLVDFRGVRLDGQTFAYAQPGIYLPTVTVADSGGNRFATSAVVQIFDLNAVSQTFQVRWTALKDTLRRADIVQALTHIVHRARPRYEEVFRALAQDLPQIDAILTDIVLLELRGHEAIHEMVRTEDNAVRSFEIRFLIDEDGIWRLWMF
ncbi:MAG TPA: hypothetical protein VGV13_12850 [Methylomirabilota bacterium]|nr:hypothetical protein [Methylomirabilota bacterium]